MYSIEINVVINDSVLTSWIGCYLYKTIVNIDVSYCIYQNYQVFFIVLSVWMDFIRTVYKKLLLFNFWIFMILSADKNPPISSFST